MASLPLSPPFATRASTPPSTWISSMPAASITSLAVPKKSSRASLSTMLPPVTPAAMA
jgi:hypothetical protein